ncbi:MAG: bile acid:sodium symporter family protein, partial [Gammaproteobacteria bacterium]|nr:bile acid:sodium symporter family protein [Gammaproteobacteria bacterium]
MLSNFNKLFPVWAVLLSLLAFYSSAFFSRFDGAIVPLLSAVMFIMGLTLSREDFIRIAKSPRAVLVGLVLQFLLMPLLALLLATILQLSNQLTIGMILVGACAGGTASNVICYLAKGDVALSISMTMASTLVGVVATPFLSSFYLAATISVDPLDMFISILQMVLLPVIAGTVLNGLLHSAIARFEPVLPSLSVVLILLIIAIVVALNADRLTEVG